MMSVDDGGATGSLADAVADGGRSDGFAVDDPAVAARLWHCVGRIGPLRRAEYDLPRPPEGLVCHAGMTLDDVEALCRDAEAGERYAHLVDQPRKLRTMLQVYVKPALDLHEAAGIDRPFLLSMGDRRDSLAVPGFSKARDLWCPGNTLLLPLKYRRHFGPVAKVKAGDIPFKRKERRLVWRGSTTDVFARRLRRPHLGSRYHVMDVADRADPSRIDVGYSAIVVDATESERPLEELARYRKDPLSIEEMLTCRYILCLEGNDVASGLKWALYSNSVVFMPPPLAESWACESFLKPFVHYVPVKADLSDLEQRVDWCDEYPGRAKRIADAGRAFMEPFMDPALDAFIARQVVKEYHKRVRLDVKP